MKTTPIRILFAISLAVLFIFTSILLVTEHRPVSYTSVQTVSNAQQIPEKINLAYEKTSADTIGVLIKTEEGKLEEVSQTIISKGISSKKHRAGKVIAANVPQNQIENIADQDGVEQILPNRIVQAFAVPETSETSAEKFWNAGVTGKDVKVAILDTGVSSENVIASADFTGSDGADGNGHGTKIAEIIISMAPGVKIINAKVLDNNGFGTEASVVAGINYAIEQKADIISISSGGLFDDINSPLVTAVEDAVSQGITVVVASGNCGKCGQCSGFIGVATPGNAPNAITVGSVDNENEMCISSGHDFGNYKKPDLVAPGKLSIGTGTSFSAPFVAGAAALLKEKYHYSPLQIKSLLEQNAKDLGDAGKDTVFGSGKLNLDFMTEQVSEEQAQEETEQKQVQEEEQKTYIPTNRQVVAFEAAPLTNNNHEKWSVLNAWDSKFLKTNFDVVDDNFIIVAGYNDIHPGITNASAFYIWNGTSWNGYLNQSIDEFFVNDVSAYSRDFAVAGGRYSTYGVSTSYLDYPALFVWNGTDVAVTRLNSTNDYKDLIIKVTVNSPTDAYAVSGDGVVYRYGGTEWSALTPRQINFSQWDDHLASSVLDSDNIMLAYDMYAEIIYYDGTSWVNTSATAVQNIIDNCEVKDIQLLSPNLAYAAYCSYVLKWNGNSWNVAYNSTSQINDLQFVDENFGFAAARNRTMIMWNGNSWTEKQYPKMNVSNIVDSSWLDGYYEFYKIDTISRTEGYAFSGRQNFLGSGEAITIYSNWEWNGIDWIPYTANFTSPLPQGYDNPTSTPTDLQNTLRFSPWKVIAKNNERYAFGYSDGVGSLKNMGLVIGSYSGILKLKKAVTLYIPPQSIDVDGTASINLDDYLTSTLPATYSVVQENTSKVDCNVAGSNLNIDGNNGFNGIALCRVKAQTADNSDTADVIVYVGVEPTQLDVYLTNEDISFSDSGNPAIKIHSVAGSAAENIDITLIETYKNSIVNQQTISYSLDTGNTVNTFTPSFTVARGHELEVVVDSGNVLAETTKGNNKARSKFKAEDLYLNVDGIEPAFAPAITDYLSKELSNYNIISSPALADAIIEISYIAGDNKLGCSNGNVYANGEINNKPYTGVIFTSGITTNICAARIEGIANAVKLLDKNELKNNRLVLFNKASTAAAGTFDFIQKERNGGAITPEIITKALYGGLEKTDTIVRASDGTYLRLRHYKPILSQSFWDYLLQIDTSKPWLEPVIMAGGLWSDIDAWDEAGQEIAMGMEDKFIDAFDSIKYTPRDVWLIELTGGPGTDCDSCDDYTYDDVVDTYWPAAVGGVLKLTNRATAAYVGHSNGGRVALDAMSTYDSIKNIVSYLSDGTTYTLPNSNPITNYIGVGVPGAFSSPTIFTEAVDNNDGVNTVNKLVSEGKTHIRLAEVAANIRTFTGFLVEKLNKNSNIKISSNLANKYFEFVDSNLDTQPGQGLTIDKVTIIYGTLNSDFGWSSDFVVPVSDAYEIYDGLNSPDKIKLNFPTGHIFQIQEQGIKTKIKERLNN